LTPSHLVIAPHSTEQVLLLFRPDQADEKRCTLGKSPLAQLVLLTGDELVRQRLVWAVQGEEGEKREEIINSNTNEVVQLHTIQASKHEKLQRTKKGGGGWKYR